MKRLFAVAALLFLLVGIAGAVSTSSGELTSSTQVYTGSVILTGVLIKTDGTNDATVAIYDGTSTAGKKVASIKVNGSDNYGGKSWSYGMAMQSGIYVDISGTGASAMVDYISPGVR